MRMQWLVLLLAFTLVAPVRAKVKEAEYKTDFLVVTSSIDTSVQNGGGCFMTLQTMDGIQYFVQGVGFMYSCSAFRSGSHLPGKIVTHMGFTSIFLLGQRDEHDKWRVAKYNVLRTAL
jgi:hypothetical protein